MKSIRDLRFLSVPSAILAFFCLVFALSENAFCQNETPASEIIRVGVIDAPPIYTRNENGGWEGLGIEIWQMVARQMGASFELLEYEDFGSLLEALENGKIDAIPTIPAELRYEVALDLSQAYFKSGLAIAVSAAGEDKSWTRIVEKIFSLHILKALGLLFLLCLTAGSLVRFFENKGKTNASGNGGIRGIGSGLWWAIVTMTTVGYGDKTPKTTGGRIAASAWMLFSIVFIAGFTANITATLTVGELRGKVGGFNDLYNVRVGSISNSEALNYLSRRGISAKPFENVRDGLRALEKKEIDAFVLNEIMLKYLIKTEFSGSVKIVPGTFDTYFVTVALGNGSALREPVNHALLQLMKTEEWGQLMNRYVHGLR